MHFENEILFYDDDVEFQEYLNYQRRLWFAKYTYFAN